MLPYLSPERLLLIAGVLTIAACGERDPYYRTDVWRPTGANAANLAAMVANPHDLIAGRGVSRVDTKASTIAVNRIWAADPKPLPAGASAGGQSAASGGGGGSPAPGG